MDLNELYKEIEKAEVDLNAKRLKYIKEALVENGGSIKLKFKEFKEFKETNDAFDFDDQFPVIIEIAGIPMYLTEVYVKKNDFRIVLLDYDDMTLGDYDNTGENERHLTSFKSGLKSLQRNMGIVILMDHTMMK